MQEMPGPLHRQNHPFHQEVLRKESPSRQRRRARCAAAKKASTTITEAVEAEEVVIETTGEQTAADDAVDEVVEHATDGLAVKLNHVDDVHSPQTLIINMHLLKTCMRLAWHCAL